MHRVRGVEPEPVLGVSAAEKDLEPGEVRLVTTASSSSSS